MNYDEIHDELKKLAGLARVNNREACGFVGVRPDPGDDFWFLYPITNTHDQPDYFYKLDSGEQLEAFTEMQVAGQRLFGVYHTHKESVHPSPEDTRHWRYPEELRMIVVTPDTVNTFVYLGEEEGLVQQVWPK
jgi:proteasome lid subunit RPN8/RPN11